MNSYTVTVSGIAERLLEPVFRKTNWIKILRIFSEPFQQISDTFSLRAIPVLEYTAQINSCKIAFEYFLNQEFSGADQPIYIINTPNPDTVVYFFNASDPLYMPVYLLDSSLAVPYSPASAYIVGSQVLDSGQIYVALQSFSGNDNLLTNNKQWFPANYFYLESDSIINPDFVVYYPAVLESLIDDFVPRLNNFIETHKMIHVTYAVESY